MSAMNSLSNIVKAAAYALAGAGIMTLYILFVVYVLVRSTLLAPVVLARKLAERHRRAAAAVREPYVTAG